MNFINTNPGWNVVQILLNYLGLPDYLRAKEYEYLDQRRTVEIHGRYQNPRGRQSNIPGEQIFWGRIFEGSILEGQKVKLVNFSLSTWFPRKPGLYWTYQAKLARNKARRHGNIQNNGMIVYDLHGKTLMTELGGVGSVNFQKGRDINLLTATSNGETHAGIPIIVTARVWDRIRDAFEKHQFIKASMDGTLVPRPTTYDSFLFRSPSIPKVAVLIDNVNLIDLSPADEPYSVTPWTVFELDQDISYGFTYATCNLGRDSIDDSVAWMQEYIRDNSGRTILTDFDEANTQLNAIFPLNDMVNNPAITRDFIEYCQAIPERYNN